MNDNKEWVRSWVEHKNNEFRPNERLTPREVEKAAIIGEASFRGQVGVGHAADAGIEAVRKLRE